MVRSPFSDLNIVPQRRQARATYLKQEKEGRIKLPDKAKHTGLDTETYKGYAKLICDDSGRHEIITDVKEQTYDNQSISEIVKFLFVPKFRSKFNWFFNIRYDFESIIKYLNKDELLTLYADNIVTISVRRFCEEEYASKRYNKHYTTYPITLRYLSGKYFGLNDDNWHVIKFYDLYNFLDTSLDNASKKFLGEEKNKDVDSGKLNIDLDYWKENYESIKKYCIQDSVLTQKLACHFWDNLMYNNMKFVPKYPFSKGKLSEEYFSKNAFIPTIDKIDKKVLEYAYNSFFGGRFELLKRGFFDKVYTYDIKSAYPSEMVDLIDFNHGKWYAFDKEINLDAYTGFYKVKITSNEINYNPVVFKSHSLNVYPNGAFMQYLTLPEIVFINNNFDNTELKIISGYEFFPNDFKYPFAKLITKLYDWKENEKDTDIRYVVKIILNSLYGKTIQVINGKTGNLFNPIYASLITSGARIKLLELGNQNPDAIIMFSTDGVHSEEKLKVPLYPKLGEFDAEFEGEGVYIMSDIYNIWNDAISKNKFRGFSVATYKDDKSLTPQLKDILETMNKIVHTYDYSRPFHLAECLIHCQKRNLDEINTWGKQTKTFNVNGDSKRLWDKSFKNGKECLTEKINSIPVIVGGLK